MWFVYGSTFNLCSPLYTGSTIFIYGWSSSICVVHYIQGPLYLYMGGPHRLIFLILKSNCPCTFKNMISFPLEISNELDEIKGKIHELLYRGFV